MAIRTVALSVVLLGLAHAAWGQTDPYDPQLDHARALRLAGNLDQADLVVRDVLSKSPTDFRALYIKGLIELDRGQIGVSVSTFNSAIASLNGRPAPDATIYNTLGYALLKEGLVDDAAAAFQKAYAMRGTLSPLSQQKLLNNMSLTYRLKGDKASADTFLSQAAAAGSPQAKANLARAASR